MFRRLAIALFLFAAACTTTGGTADAPVRAAMSGFMDALNALDVDRMAAYFADDVTAFVPLRQADRVNGKAAVVEIFRKYVEAAGGARTNLVPEDLRIDRYGETAIATFNLRGQGGVVSRRTFVFHLERGRWLITHFHASNFRPST